MNIARFRGMSINLKLNKVKPTQIMLSENSLGIPILLEHHFILVFRIEMFELRVEKLSRNTNTAKVLGILLV